MRTDQASFYAYFMCSEPRNSSFSIASSNSSLVVVAASVSSSVAVSVLSPASLFLSRLLMSSSLNILSIEPRLMPTRVSLRPRSIILSTFNLFPKNLSLGNALCCPTCNILPSCLGLGSLNILQKSETMDLGQIVIVPENCWSQISLQSWPRGRGRSSRWRRTFSHLLRSSLRYCSVALPKKPPRQPRPRRWVTGCPTEPREEKKKRLICGLTWLTILKLTLKCRFSAFKGMSVRRLPSFHLWPKE